VLGRVGKVKTPKSRSTLPLDAELATLLLEYKQRTAPAAGPNDWVFENPRTGRPWRPSRIQTRYISPAGVKVTGRTIGWHNFRHTFSTMLRALGTDVKVQQELLCHADIHTTLNLYTQAVTAQKREAIGKVTRLVLSKKTDFAAIAAGTA
jgi:integrase